MPKVMIIEDDNSMRFLLNTLLQLEGFQVIEDSGTGESEAIIGIMDSERPDVIYMDVHIGNKSGVDVLKQMRTNKALDSLKVLMSSGMDLSLECTQAGADGFIMKPFMPEELIEKIKTMSDK